jgi:hypothetical protein
MKSLNAYTKLFVLPVLFFVAIACPVKMGAMDAERLSDGSNIKINPDYKIRRVSNGAVIVTSTNPKDATVKHEFTDFYADLLMAAYRKQGMDYITSTLKKKYYLSEDDCRREIKHAVNVLSEWKIIIREEPLAAR